VNADRFYSLVAERALVGGRALDKELGDAARLAGGAPGSVRGAVAHFEAGRLADGLSALLPLGFDPLLAQAAALRPAHAGEVSLRLRMFPSLHELCAPLLPPTIYLALVLSVEALVPPFLAQALAPADPFGAIRLVGVGGVAAVLAAFFMWAAVLLASGKGARPLLKGVIADFDTARLFSCVSVFEKRGELSDEAVAQIQKLLSGAGTKTFAVSADADFAELSTFLIERMRERILRLSIFVRLMGAAVALSIAGIVASSIYLWLPAFARAAAGVP
jgi:hypothetical protein